MHFKEIQINNRLQIDVETVESGLDTYRGIVIDISDSKLILVSDFGKLITIYRDDILSITKINFDRAISSSILNIKNYYQERKDLEDRLNTLLNQEEQLVEDLFDANMLSRFNIAGAKNRLDKSIPKDLLRFNRGIYNYNIYFSHNPNNEIEIMFKASTTFEHYNSENIDIDKVIRAHSPNEKDVIEKSFDNLGKVLEVERNAVHETGDIYTVFTIYKMLVEVNVENFVTVREKIKRSLNKLKR